MKKPLLVLLVVLGASLVLPAQAQVFDDPQNLKVLPEDISPADLRATMMGFAMSTGLRCSNCHVGEEGADLSTYDFAADEKEDKAVARKMLRMVNAINNEYMADIDQDPIEVRCITCHRGVKKPRMTGEVLVQAAGKGGVDGLNKTYRDMRGQYYGTHSYDFSDMTLAGVAQTLAQSGQMAEATAMLDLILEDSPDSFNAIFLYGEISAGQGELEAAKGYYEKALELNPNAAPFIQPKIDALTASE